MNSDELRVAVVQMTSVDDWEINIKEAVRKTRLASQAGQLDVVCLPENALYMRLNPKAPIQGVELGWRALDPLAELAQELGCVLMIGSLPLKLEDGLFNSTVVFWPDGRREAPYQKIHLFDIQLAGQDPIMESSDFKQGRSPSVLNIKGWKWGLSICYDLRFSELYSCYHKEDVDVLAVPSAFLVKTGEAHWHTLLRARAIEAQAYVVAAAQSGSHGGVRETYGHSLVADPWGEVVAECEVPGPGLLVTRLSRRRIEAVRQQIPMEFHRRL